MKPDTRRLKLPDGGESDPARSRSERCLSSEIPWDRPRKAPETVAVSRCGGNAGAVAIADDAVEQTQRIGKAGQWAEARVRGFRTLHSGGPEEYQREMRSWALVTFVGNE